MNTTAIDSELQKLFSPSQWSKRFSRPDEAIEDHLKVLSENSELSRDHVEYISVEIKENKVENSNENFIQIFYKNDQSISIISQNDFNLKSKNVFVYLHGGYWQWGSYLHSSFIARNFTQKDISVISVGYNLCPLISLDKQVEEVERLIVRILQCSQPDSQIFICGHSAGAHLAAMLLYTDFKTKYNVDAAKNLRGFILVSGCFYLEPLIKTDINDNLKLSVDLAKRMSPLLKEKHECFFGNANAKNQALQAQIMIAYAKNESPAFIQQSEDYAQLLKSNYGLSNVETIEIDDADHFDIIEKLRFDDYILTKKIYELMGL